MNAENDLKMWLRRVADSPEQLRPVDVERLLDPELVPNRCTIPGMVGWLRRQNVSDRVRLRLTPWSDEPSPSTVQAQPAAQFPPLTLEREYNEKGTRDEAQGRTSIEFAQNGVPIGMWIDFEEEGRGKRAKLFAAAPDLLSACKDLVSLIDVENHDVDSVTIKVRDLVPFVRAARAALGKATGSRESTPVLAHKQCSCCGLYAGMFRQHWNRDAGWGICRPCVLTKYRGKGESEAEILSLFGPEGVCWATERQWDVEQRDEIALRR